MDNPTLYPSKFLALKNNSDMIVENPRKKIFVFMVCQEEIYENKIFNINKNKIFAPTPLQKIYARHIFFEVGWGPNVPNLRPMKKT